MIRKKEKEIIKEIVIDLTGTDGNAYILLGKARSFAKQLGYSDLEIQIILDQMRSNTYEELIKLFDYYFGDFVILER